MFDNKDDDKNEDETSAAPEETVSEQEDSVEEDSTEEVAKPTLTEMRASARKNRESIKKKEAEKK